MKKFVIGACALALAATSLFAEGKVLNIYCWNDEFTSRFNDFYAANKPKALEGVEVKWHQIPNQGSAYQDALDAALAKQGSAKADDKIDIFLVEADYAKKYTKAGVALDVQKDIGLSKKDMANQFEYTKNVVTDAKGAIRGTSWQACPAAVIYRRSIAKAVFGTDDPAKVQAKISDWKKFDAAAAELKAKGYYMVAGFDDIYRVYDDNRTKAWVKGNKIQIDPKINDWIKQTKEYTEKGYNNKTSLWDDTWNAGMMADGKVFAYFGPNWLINFCMHDGEAGSATGDWAIAQGPQGYSWGGTWICAAEGTDNKALVKDIMLALTCDADNMKALSIKTLDFANNTVAMNALANDDNFKAAFLGGQNPYGMMVANCAAIKKNVLTPYEQQMTEKLQAAMKDYYLGKVDLDKAWDNFYTSVIEALPNLKK